MYDLQSVRAGITWCQTPNGQRCDLDLSVTVHDAKWAQIAQCSFIQLQLGKVLLSLSLALSFELAILPLSVFFSIPALFQY